MAERFMNRLKNAVKTVTDFRLVDPEFDGTRELVNQYMYRGTFVHRSEEHSAITEPTTVPLRNKNSTE